LGPTCLDAGPAPSHHRRAAKAPVNVNSHRSHFGSRYRLGCCGNAGLFAPARRARVPSHQPAEGMRLKQPGKEIKTCLSSRGLVLVTVRRAGFRSAWDCWSSCKLRGWLAITKQLVCKGVPVQTGRPWQLKARGTARAGDRIGKTERQLQWCENRRKHKMVERR
jgi:hypothetical protein